jgi:hypothetical protein
MWEQLPEMPLFSLSRLLIFEEKEAHREKMHAHTGSQKIILLLALFNLDFGQFGIGLFRTLFLKIFDPVIQQ